MVVEIIFLLLVGVALWLWVVEPNRDIYPPTKKIIKLIEGHGRFIIRRPTAAEREADGLRLSEIILFDKETGQKTSFWLYPMDDNYILRGDLDWMTTNEGNKVGRLCRKMLDAEEEISRTIKESKKLISDAARREQAKKKFQ